MALPCPVCQQGSLVRRTLEHADASELVGVSVVVTDAPVFACAGCDAVAWPRPLVTALHDAVARVLIAEASSLAGGEVRFLRVYLGATQTELAHRLGVHRVSVARWEAGAAPLPRSASVALRALAALRLATASPGAAAALERAFVDPPPTPAPRPLVLAASALRLAPSGPPSRPQAASFPPA